MAGWTYIMTNKPAAFLMSALPPTSRNACNSTAKARVQNSARGNLKLLVLAEHHGTIDEAIRREKMLKEWKREWKIELIERSIPNGAICSTTFGNRAARDPGFRRDDG